LYQKENCPPVQQVAYQPPGSHPELIGSAGTMILDAGAGVPARHNVSDPDFIRGERLQRGAMRGLPCRNEAGAAEVAADRGGVPRLHRPLLDVGGGRRRPDFAGRVWRTAAVGLGLSPIVNGSSAMLHDGRARSATEAILWHGGEAQRSREAFRNMPKADREALLNFLSSI
jgi:CxxC motif-containing protein (DUF1111 family)